jgi:hypothetical protein
MPEEATEDVVAAYRATSDAANRAIEDLGLDAVGKHWSGEAVSLRGLLGRMASPGGPLRPPATGRATGYAIYPLNRHNVEFSTTTRGR